MEKKIVYLIICFCFAGLTTHAQQYCGAAFLHEHLMQTDSAYRQRYETDEVKIESCLKNIPHYKMQSQVYTIPLVVHVVHKGEAVGSGTNVSDANINAAIQTLNNSFRNVNNKGVDVQINFKLATTDPNGNATTGINRVNGTVVSGYSSGGINNYLCPSSYASEHAVKDLSKWPVASYMNIWIVYTICGFNYGGIATGISGSPYDGICIKSTAINATAMDLSHEVGHMLGLLHTFQGDNASHTTCPADTSCSFNGDKICDTPPHRQLDSGATNPCTSAGVWNNTRYNYMSYNHVYLPSQINASTCRFTQGQKDRMRAVLLTNSLNPYLNSRGAIPPRSVNDAGIEKFIYPVLNQYTTKCTAADSISPVVELKNYGSGALTSVTIKYKLDNGSLQALNWTGNLGTDSSQYVTLAPLLTSKSSHVLLAFTTSPNNTTDGYTSNDSADFSFTYKQAKPFNLYGSKTGVSFGGTNNGSATVTVNSTVQITEDFEGTTDWIISNGSEVNKWKIGTAIANGGTKSIYISNNDTDNVYNIYTPSVVHFYKDFYFPAGATNIKIKFDWTGQGQFSGFPGGIDQLKVYVKPTSQSVIALGEQTGYLGSYFSQSTFRTDSIMNLDTIAGSSRRIIFSWRNDYDYGTQAPASVDNVIISYDPPGSPSYTYSWNTNPVQTTATATGLSASTYTATVTDTNGCVDSLSFAIPQLLPVQLIYFNGSANQKDAMLEWQTASELNNYGFDVERLNNNSNWSKVGFVAGNGTSNTVNSYTFTDVNAFAQQQLQYYRLRQIDFNQSFNYSTVIGISGSGVTASPGIVSPNPSGGLFYIDLLHTTHADNCILEIFSPLGQKVFEQPISTQNNKVIAPEMKNGVYYYQLKNYEGVFSSGKLVFSK